MVHSTTILAYANTKDGYHTCINCTTNEQKQEYYPLTYDDLWEYKYADYKYGCSDTPNPPSCDRCLEEIRFEE